MKFIVCVAATLALGALSAPAEANSVIYTATLTGPAESPPNASPGTGIATVTVDFDVLTMRVQTTFADLTAPDTASHIHCCTSVADAGTAGVATQTPYFTGFPIGVTAGSYDQTFDMTQASSYNAAFITAQGGSVGDAFNALVAGMNGGYAYFNIHSSGFPGGEIRGFLAPVPLPAAAWMLGGALLGLGALKRRRAPD